MSGSSVPLTAAAAAASNGPANTPRWVNKRRADGDSSSWLQSSVARSVCCRYGASRGPPVSSAMRDRSRGSRSRGG